MEIPENLWYTRDHEWVLFEDQQALVGITDFAQRELGDIVYLDVPCLDQTIEKETVFGTVEAVKTVSDLYMPVTGKVIAVNDQLGSRPELVNKAPYESWIIRVAIDNPEDKGHLLAAAQYRDLLQ